MRGSVPSASIGVSKCSSVLLAPVAPAGCELADTANDNDWVDMTEQVHGMLEMIVVDDREEIAKAEFYGKGQPPTKPYLRLVLPGGQSIAITTNIAEMIGGAGKGLRERWEESLQRVPDPRIVYGARCSWWDSISMVGDRGGLPCCPYCGNVLFEVANEAEWKIGIERHAAQSNDSGYVTFMEWLRGKCYPNLDLARAAFEASKAH